MTQQAVFSRRSKLSRPVFGTQSVPILGSKITTFNATRSISKSNSRKVGYGTDFHQKWWLLYFVLGMAAILPLTVRGHGRMMDPPSRNSMWRLGFPNPVNYNDNELYCGGRVVGCACNALSSMCKTYSNYCDYYFWTEKKSGSRGGYRVGRLGFVVGFCLMGVK